MTPYQIEKATRAERDIVRKKKPRKRSGWPRGVSDTMLQDLWRKVVREDWGGVCALKDTGNGLLECQGPLECHHIKRRNIPHLRYCPSNGVLLCAAHHGEMKYELWRMALRKLILDPEWLDIMERKLFPVFLAERGQTRGEYLLAQRDYLRKLLQAPWRNV